MFRSRRGRLYFRTAAVGLFLALALVPSMLRLPTIAIITTAQVTNGLLLPCVASMLLLSLNHTRIMGAAKPQAAALNALMIPCVGITIYLACVVLLKHSLGRLPFARDPTVPIAVAAPLAATLLLALTFVTASVRADGSAAAVCAWCAGRRRRQPTARAQIAEVSLSEVPPC